LFFSACRRHAKSDSPTTAIYCRQTTGLQNGDRRECAVKP
jgi:hypothetical protein